MEDTEMVTESMNLTELPPSSLALVSACPINFPSLPIIIYNFLALGSGYVSGREVSLVASSRIHPLAQRLGIEPKQG